MADESLTLQVKVTRSQLESMWTQLSMQQKAQLMGEVLSSTLAGA